VDELKYFFWYTRDAHTIIPDAHSNVVFPIEDSWHQEDWWNNNYLRYGDRLKEEEA